ncbi:MAG: tRNA epoxyqueuosine(34) reductase QueG [Acidobacteriota bacterium]|nr:tRNA epoxyqueuosine(34) reductase QueG [Acidobacteriota bacterium]
MRVSGRTPWIVKRALAAGFDHCGVASLGSDAFPGDAPHIARREDPKPPAVPALDAPKWEELRRMPEWLARGYAGEMNYLHDPRRLNPRGVLAGTRSVIVTATNYRAPAPLSSELRAANAGGAPRGWISRYAWGDDYHETILPKLNALIAQMRDEFGEPFEARAYVDTGPVVERLAAKYAGLGWLAKNTCLINQKLGSWLFLGVIITTLDLEPSLAPGEPPAADLCGSCTRCLDACPTRAFPEPYVLDARRCISYLTIELREAIPEEFRSSMGNAVIGCDICQDVCPWNRKAPVTRLAAFEPREITPETAGCIEQPSASRTTPPVHSVNDSGLPQNVRSLFAPELGWLAGLSQPQFSEIFRRSAVKRAKWRGLVRNACIALGNSRVSQLAPDYARIIRLLEQLAASADSLISEHARWALDRLSHTSNRGADPQRPS